jgi:hypothetical protein
LGNAFGNPSPPKVLKIFRDLSGAAVVLKRDHRRNNIYSRAVFGELIVAATDLAKNNGLITP